MVLMVLNVLHFLGVTVFAGVLFVLAFVMPQVAKRVKMPVGRLRIIVLEQSKVYLLISVAMLSVSGIGLTAIHWDKMQIPLYAGLVITKAILTALVVGNLWYITRSVWLRGQQKQQPKNNVVEFSMVRHKQRFTKLVTFNLAGLALLLIFAAYLREL